MQYDFISKVETKFLPITNSDEHVDFLSKFNKLEI